MSYTSRTTEHFTNRILFPERDNNSKKVATFQQIAILRETWDLPKYTNYSIRCSENKNSNNGLQ